MPSRKGPTWAAIHADFRAAPRTGVHTIERREISGQRVYFAKDGKTEVDFECPFCRKLVVARTWSISGGGKRCECGAMCARNNRDDTYESYHWIEEDKRG